MTARRRVARPDDARASDQDLAQDCAGAAPETVEALAAERAPQVSRHFVRAIEREEAGSVDPLDVAGVATISSSLFGWLAIVRADPVAAAYFAAAEDQPGSVWAALTESGPLHFLVIDDGAPFVTERDRQRFAILRLIAERCALSPETRLLRSVVLERHRLDPGVDRLALELQVASALVPGERRRVTVESAPRPGAGRPNRRCFDPVFVVSGPGAERQRLDRPGALRLLARLHRRLASGLKPAAAPSPGVSP